MERKGYKLGSNWDACRRHLKLGYCPSWYYGTVIWGYGWLKASEGFPKFRYPRLGMDAQFLRIIILAGPAHLLVQHEVHQL